MPLGRFLRIALLLMLLMVGFLLIYSFVVREELMGNAPLLFELGPLQIYQAGALYGLATAR